MSLSAYLPALIMFSITVSFVSLCFLPATFERRSKLVNFYWVGFWLFLGLIAAISGATQTVLLAGMDADFLALRLQTAATLCFVIFVMFAWLRLSGAAFMAGARRLTRYRRAPAS
ncbi:MAG: hypothetical protein AAF926_09180 [Pseudomonadota bacterium]